MKVKLQFPPNIEATMDVVAADQRQDLRLIVECVDRSSWRFSFRWAGNDDGMPVAVLDGIEEVTPHPARARMSIQDLTPPHRLLGE